MTTAHNDILRRNIPLATIDITTALNSNTIISGIKCTAFDQNIFTTFWVTTITIRTTIEHLNSTNYKIITKEGVNHPERRIEQLYILNQNSVTTIEINKLRTHAIFRTKDTLIDWHLFFAPLQQTCTSAIALSTHSLFPSKARSTTHCPPIFISTLSIENTFTSQCNISFSVCINKRTSIITINTFPTSKNAGEIKILVGRELQYCAICKMKIDITLQSDGTGEICAIGNQNCTTTFLVTNGNGKIDSIMSQYNRTIGSHSQSTKIFDVINFVAETHFFDVFHDFCCFSPRAISIANSALLATTYGQH